MNCIHSFEAENKLKSHKNKDLCGIVMLSEKYNISEFNQFMKTNKMLYITYADIESLKEKIDGWVNNQERSSTTKIGEHIPCGYSMSTIWAFDSIENKSTLYRGEDCMKKFCTSLREHDANVINFEKKEMLPLTKEELKSHQDAKVCYICGKRILKMISESMNHYKVIILHYIGKYIGAVHNIYNLKFNVFNEIPAVFHIDSNYDYHFKELSKN